MALKPAARGSAFSRLVSGRVDDPGHPQKGLVGQFIVLDDHIEGAKIFPVMPFGPRGVKGDRSFLFGDPCVLCGEFFIVAE